MTCSGSSDVPSLIHHSYIPSGGEGGGGGEDERERVGVERGGNSKQQSTDILVVAFNNPLHLSYCLSAYYVSLKSK